MALTPPTSGEPAVGLVRGLEEVLAATVEDTTRKSDQSSIKKLYLVEEVSKKVADTDLRFLRH